MATPIIGPIVEEPEVYEESSPLRSQPTRHRLRRASSVTMWDRGASTLQKTGATLPPLGDYKRRSQSTVSLPSNHVRGFSTLSDPFVVLAGETASPTREDEDEAISGAEEESTFVYAPVTPDHIVSKRYKRTYFHAKEYTEDTPKIRALQTSFSPRPTVISENGAFIWRPCESPEGNLYFRDEKNNVMTFVDLYDPSYREGVSGFAQFLLAKMEQEKAMPDDTELAIVLEDYGADCDYGYGYYLASWKGKCVFWLEEVDYDFVTDGARICITESHIGKHIEYLFWLHVEMFPCHRSPSQQILDELKDQLNLGMYDHITSQNSIFPYDKDESADSLRCIKKIRPNEENATGIWIVARCKQNLIQHAFLNYFGERGARIHRTDSVLEKSLHKPRSWFFCILTPFLFFMPSVYMEEIDNVWIDETVDSINWRRFITMLTRDWEHSITPATVILSANVGFLAIQSIDVNSPHRTAAQIASYISGVLALFNYIVCQVLARHHRHSDHFATHKAGEFLERRQSQWLGLESVAITFSLPTALFIWSMLTFLVALMIVFFWQTSLATRVSLGAVLVFMFSLTAILLWLDWESHKEFPWKSMLYRICPSGLCTTVLHVRESWQVTSRFRLRRKKGSSIGSDTSTAVNSDRSLGPL